jgi:hypothetical protein
MRLWECLKDISGVSATTQINLNQSIYTGITELLQNSHCINGKTELLLKTCQVGVVGF